MSSLSEDKRTPYEKVRDQLREISLQVRRENNQLNRQIYKLDRDIQRITHEIRKNALHTTVIRTLSKEYLKIKDEKSSLCSAQANFDIIYNAIQNQLMNFKGSGIMKKSAEIAHSLLELMKIDQVREVVQKFSQELFKMGIIDEIMPEVVGAVKDKNELEKQTILAKVPPISPTPRVPALVTVSNDDSEHVQLQKRLQALKC